ncbi:hypothetical protein FEF34_37185 [Streptomyces marianii]|uniref:Uncharacterized protein n=1 Tax=Streptomyces marianii TaxID=1817406 RepID=A0A5R9EG65_9ACTN|nr:hypothetical protein FEF34_37185 [Streptomyces marianii]
MTVSLGFAPDWSARARLIEAYAEWAAFVRLLLVWWRGRDRLAAAALVAGPAVGAVTGAFTEAPSGRAVMLCWLAGALCVWARDVRARRRTAQTPAAAR